MQVREEVEALANGLDYELIEDVDTGKFKLKGRDGQTVKRPSKPFDVTRQWDTWEEVGEFLKTLRSS